MRSIELDESSYMTQARDLLALQDIDLGIATRTKQIEDLPEKQQILALRKQKAQIAAKDTQVQAIVSSLKGEIKKAESDITSIKDQMDQVQRQIAASGDHKAVAALTHEMESFKKQVEKIEFAEMNTMEKREKAREAEVQVANALEAAQAKEAELIKAYQAHGKVLQDEITSLMQQRSEVVARIDEATLAKYSELIETKRGIAVSQLQGKTCSVCRVNLSESQYEGLRTGASIGVCPSCRRMIVVAE